MPAGLALDPKTRVLFVACRNPAALVMMNADSGAVLDAIPIGLGNDGVVFNPDTARSLRLAGRRHPGGGEGNSATRFVLEQTLATQSGAKTMALDTKTGHIFLIAAEYGPCRQTHRRLSNGRIARGPMRRTASRSWKSAASRRLRAFGRLLALFAFGARGLAPWRRE